MYKINTLNTTVFNAARDSGANIRTLVDTLRKANIKWDNKDKVDEIGLAFKLGRIAGYLRLKDADEAERILNLRPWDAKTPDVDAKRTPEQHKAVRAAISAWSTTCLMAGMPNKRTGAARANKSDNSDKSASNAQAAPRNAPAVVAPIRPIRTYEDAYTFALQIRDAFVRFESLAATAKVQLGDLGTIFREYCDKVHTLKPAAQGDKKNAA